MVTPSAGTTVTRRFGFDSIGSGAGGLSVGSAIAGMLPLVWRRLPSHFLDVLFVQDFLHGQQLDDSFRALVERGGFLPASFANLRPLRLRFIPAFASALFSNFADGMAAITTSVTTSAVNWR